MIHRAVRLMKYYFNDKKDKQWKRTVKNVSDLQHANS